MTWKNGSQVLIPKSTGPVAAGRRGFVRVLGKLARMISGRPGLHLVCGPGPPALNGRCIRLPLCFGDLNLALDLAFANKLEPEDRAVCREFFQRMFG